MSLSTSTAMSSRISRGVSAARTGWDSTVNSLKKTFSRSSTTGQTSQVLAETSDPATPIATSYLAPVTSVSAPFESGSDLTQITNTSASSSSTGTSSYESASWSTAWSYSTDRSTPPVSTRRRSPGSQSTGLRISSPTDDLTPYSATPFIFSPQDRKSTIFASLPTGGLLSATAISANTVYTATSPIFSMASPLPQTTTVADLFSDSSPTNVSSLYDTRRITGPNSRISSYVDPASPPPVTQIDDFYTRYSGAEVPSYANIVATVGFGGIPDSRATLLSPLGYTGEDRGDGLVTPHPSFWTTSSV